MKIRVGIVGCGAIGTYLIKTIIKDYKKQVSLIGVCEPDNSKVIELGCSLKKKIKNLSLEQLVKQSELIIEAANIEAAVDVLKQALKWRKQVMVMSVGSLLLEPGLLLKIKKSKLKLYVPSGAIAGLDALKAARMGKIHSVKLTTVKPIDGLAGAPYIISNKINLNKIKKERIIFKGSAGQAVSGFPKNINVAAILSLVGLGAEKTQVSIVASRTIKRNTHSIEIRGNFGTIICCASNVPSDVNPKTSMLAMLSALATLDGILGNVRIGT